MAVGKITARQLSILEFIKKEILERGYPPSVREICDAVNLKSTSSAHAHLATLERNGYIKRDPSKPRTIEILDDEFQSLRFNMVNIPILGKIEQVGELITDGNVLGRLPISANIAPKGELFAIQAKTDYAQEGVLTGDYLFICDGDTPADGDKVAFLQYSPTNESGPVIIKKYNHEAIATGRLLGKIFGVFRLYNQAKL